MAFLPGWVPVTAPPSYVASPQVINSVATTAHAAQAQVAGRGAPLRVVLGTYRIGAQIAAKPVVYNGCWIILANWCLGEIDSILDITINDQPLPEGTVVTNYTGTGTQTPDPTMVAAYAAQSPPIVYADALLWRAYSVLAIPFNSTSGFPTAKATIKGSKIFDERTGLTVWSDTPALGFAAFLNSPTWGEGKTVTGAGDLATLNEALIGTAPLTEKHRTLGLVLDTRQPHDAWRETLRVYAGCLVIPEGDGYRLVPDAPADVAMTFDVGGANDNIIQLGDINIAGRRSLPTAIRVGYTNADDWTDEWTPYVTRPGVDTGEVEWRPLDVRLPGIHRLSQAMRERNEILNKLWLCDVTGDIYSTDIGLRALPGSVVELTDPRGLESKKVRLLGVSGERGRLRLPYAEYDPAAYCLDVVENPTTPDTVLPQPTNPPSITGLVITERVYQMQTGTFASRFEVTWNAVEFPFPMVYRVRLLDGSTQVDAQSLDVTGYASPAVQEGKTYTVVVTVISTSVGKSGLPVQEAQLAQGKLLVPGDVPFFNAHESGGTTYMFWTPGADLDRTGHEIRRAYIDAGETVAQHWARGVVVNRVADPAVAYPAPNEPVGTWRYMIKCLDSVRSALYPFGQESVNAAYKDVVVTSDANAIWSDTHLFAGQTLTNMHEYNDWPPTRSKFVSVGGLPVGTAMPNAANTYPNPTATYDPPASSEYLTTSHDFGAIVSGQWLVEAGAENFGVTNLSGTAVVSIELSDNGTDWVPYTGTSCKAAGRFARIRVATTGVMVVTGHPTLRVSSTPKTEKHTVTTSASGPVTLTLDHRYIASVGQPQTQAVGSSPIFHSCDNIVVSPTATNTVQVSAWNISGSRVAAQIGVTFNGILAT